MTKYNIKGFAVGNGVTNWNFDVFASTPDTFYGFNMIPKTLYDTYNDNYCVQPFNGMNPTNGTDPKLCDDLFNEMMDLVAPLNYYDLFRKVYPDGEQFMALEDRMETVTIGGQEKTYRKGFTAREMSPWKTMDSRQPVKELTQSADLSTLVNTKEMREALHIPDEVPAWEQCTSNEDFKWTYQQEGSQWIYEVLKQAGGIKMMHFSGDTDGMVPTSGTRKWVKELNYPVMEKHRPWMSDNQVAGFVTRYEGLDFVTVKGVGHMAPQWARPQVLQLISDWIHNDTI